MITPKSSLLLELLKGACVVQRKLKNKQTSKSSVSDDIGSVRQSAVLVLTGLLKERAEGSCYLAYMLQVTRQEEPRYNSRLS